MVGRPWRVSAPQERARLQLRPRRRTVGRETMQWEYFDRMVLFSETPEGMVSGLETWINGAGADGWELVSSAPLIAPNRDGVAYGTIGVHLVFKRPRLEAAEG